MSLLQSQERPRPYCPSRALWNVVLFTGLREAAKALNRKRELSLDEKEAVAWVTEYEIRRGGLDWICRELDLSATRIRANFAKPSYRQELIRFGRRIKASGLYYGGKKDSSMAKL